MFQTNNNIQTILFFTFVVLSTMAKSLKNSNSTEAEHRSPTSLAAM